MRIVAINEAEAIIEPFFDGGTSEPDNPDPRYRVLDEYQVQVLNGAIGSIRQGWAFATIQLDKAAGSLPALEMHRSCRLDDRFVHPDRFVSWRNRGKYLLAGACTQ